jgi:formate transporter
VSGGTFGVQRLAFNVQRSPFSVRRSAFSVWGQAGGIEDAWATTMDYIKPADVVQNMVETAVTKAGLSIPDFLIRGFLSGALLGFATTLAFTATKQTNLPIVGAIIFPVGFVLIILLGLELVTGNFALLPLAYQAKRISAGRLLANLCWVYVGNLLGSIFFGCLFVATLLLSASPQTTIAPLVIAAAEAKTIYYGQHGMEGLLVCVVKAVLCNWMVCLGTVAAMTSTSTLGKTIASAMPIFIFFALGFEHSVVNMFLIPTGILLGAKVSFTDWWLWNQIPVTIGNLLGGWLLIGLPLFVTYGKRTQRKGVPSSELAEAPR